MGAYQDKMDAIAEAQAMADIQNQQMSGYTRPSHAYEAPETFVVEGAIFTPFASPAPPTQPFNPPAVGIAPFLSNAWKSVSEIMLQQKPAIPTPPSYTYEGPIGGGGPLGLFAPEPGSQKYKEFVELQELKEHYNEEKVGIAPLPDNEKSTAIETAKQTQGPSLWESFTGAVKEGYTKEPEDVNTFTKSVEQLGAVTSNIIKPSNYVIMAIAGVVLLVVLLK